MEEFDLNDFYDEDEEGLDEEDEDILDEDGDGEPVQFFILFLVTVILDP